MNDQAMLTPLTGFQTQIAAIMEAVSKTAVLEISKLVQIECEVLTSELHSSKQEAEFLRKRLQLMEKHMHMKPMHEYQEFSNTASASVQFQPDAEVSPRTDTQSAVKRYECFSYMSCSKLYTCHYKAHVNDLLNCYLLYTFPLCLWPAIA